uniref:rhomboid protease n=1 Tax=Macrostomum lignano TaxID=282301 RepID=A0A1I8HYM6_9PLAT
QQHCGQRILVTGLRSGGRPPQPALILLRNLSRRRLTSPKSTYSSSSSSSTSTSSAGRRLIRGGVTCAGLGLATFAVGRVSLYERLKGTAGGLIGDGGLDVRRWLPSDWRHYPMHAYALIGVNAIVFLLWQLPAARPVLNRWAMLWPSRLGPLSLIGSMFSHQHWLHLLVNMLVLHSFAPALTAQLGSPEEFLCLYACSGLCAGFMHAALIPSLPCIGASGCLLGIFAYTAITNPDAKVGLVLISSLFPDLQFTAYNAFLAMVAFDVAGLCRLFDLGLSHAAHLGGSAFGTAYANGLRPWLWLRWGDLALGCWMRLKRAV